MRRAVLAIAFAQYIVCEKVNRKAAAEPAGPSLFGEEPPAAPQSGNGMMDSVANAPAAKRWYS